MTPEARRPGEVLGGIIAALVLGIIGAVLGRSIGAQPEFGHISGFDLRSLMPAVGKGALVLFIFGLLTRARA